MVLVGSLQIFLLCISNPLPYTISVLCIFHLQPLAGVSVVGNGMDFLVCLCVNVTVEKSNPSVLMEMQRLLSPWFKNLILRRRLCSQHHNTKQQTAARFWNIYAEKCKYFTRLCFLAGWSVCYSTKSKKEIWKFLCERKIGFQILVTKFEMKNIFQYSKL